MANWDFLDLPPGMGRLVVCAFKALVDREPSPCVVVEEFHAVVDLFVDTGVKHFHCYFADLDIGDVECLD